MQFKSAVLNVYKRRCSVHVLVCVIWIQNTIWNIILIVFFYLFTTGLVSFWQKQVRLSYIHIFVLKCIRWPHFPLKGQTCPWCDYLSENIYFGKHLRRDWLHLKVLAIILIKIRNISPQIPEECLIRGLIVPGMNLVVLKSKKKPNQCD